MAQAEQQQAQVETKAAAEAAAAAEKKAAEAAAKAEKEAEAKAAAAKKKAAEEAAKKAEAERLASWPSSTRCRPLRTRSPPRSTGRLPVGLGPPHRSRLRRPTGTLLKAVRSGTITSAGWDGSYGYKTVLTLDDGTELWYAHQSSISVSVGQKVTTGDVIGRVGATGNVAGAHLHLEVHTAGGSGIDPMAWLQSKGLTP
ncbi:Glycyl-glycine endopeptidase ALE-1 [Streptomyces tendae]